MAEVWTHGRWVATPGDEEAFIAAWTDFARWTTGEFPIGSGMLLRDLETPNRFYSFGPWPSMDVVRQWRASEGFAERLGRIHEHLEAFEAFTLEPVATIGGS